MYPYIKFSKLDSERLMFHIEDRFTFLNEIDDIKTYLIENGISCIVSETIKWKMVKHDGLKFLNANSIYRFYLFLTKIGKTVFDCNFEIGKISDTEDLLYDINPLSLQNALGYDEDAGNCRLFESFEREKYGFKIVTKSRVKAKKIMRSDIFNREMSWTKNGLEYEIKVYMKDKR